MQKIRIVASQDCSPEGRKSDSLLRSWTHDGPDGRVRTRSVWFYPWKYHSKEDVWRGLVSEVIIESLAIENVTVEKVVNAGKRFGMFLGKAFLRVLAGVKLKASAGVAEGEVGLSVIKEAVAEYQEAAHPEKAYLNEFENSLEIWLRSTLGKNERMVIFIDDLDRCMPEVALEVLEALKLYLSDTQVADVSPLASLERLKTLNLRGTPASLDNDGIARLKQALPGIRILA